MFIELNKLKKKSIDLLISLINTPSISRYETKTADIISNYLYSHGVKIKRKFNNIWAVNNNFYYNKKNTILLNSHHDTVNHGKNWNTNPFLALKDNDKIIGLGSNDAGASVVSLISTFIYLNQLKYLPYKLILSITAEEEISGLKGVKSIIPELGKIDLGIIGEPTGMNIAIAEKGLIVLDCVSIGRTGHVCFNKGVNALYIALDDIKFLRNKIFKKSPILGSVKINVTQMNCGIQHNVIPDICSFVVDIRTNEYYDNIELINIIKNNIKSKVTPRSYNLNSSFINNEHPILKKAKKLKIKTFGSSTLSDQSIMNFPTIKIGPGKSIRSHSPNEYILSSEIKNAIDIYIKLLENFNFD